MIVVEMAYKNNLSFRTLWIEIQFAKKTIVCATDKTKPLLSPTVIKEQLPICQSGWKKVGGLLVEVQLSFETNSFQTRCHVNHYHHRKLSNPSSVQHLLCMFLCITESTVCLYAANNSKNNVGSLKL